MRTRFDTRSYVIVVRARAAGITTDRTVRMMLDTGSTYTVLAPWIIEVIGGVQIPGATTTIITASRVERAERFRCEWFAALGIRREGFAIVGHPLPPAAQVDGLLGLDFLRDTHLRIDFRAGTIDLA